MHAWSTHTQVRIFGYHPTKTFANYDAVKSAHKRAHTARNADAILIFVVRNRRNDENGVCIPRLYVINAFGYILSASLILEIQEQCYDRTGENYAA